MSQLHFSNILLIDSLGLIEQWESADTTTANPTWQNIKANLLTQISINQELITSLNDNIRAARLAGLEGVRTYVENLPQNNSLEANFRILLLLLVKQHSEETWTTADSAALRAIAYTCPATGGEAVTIAREMLPSPEAYMFGREGTDLS